MNAQGAADGQMQQVQVGKDTFWLPGITHCGAPKVHEGETRCPSLCECILICFYYIINVFLLYAVEGMICALSWVRVFECIMYTL